MPDYIIKNPYSSLPDSEKKNSSVRLSVRDIAYLNQTYPMLVGKLDKVLSSLFSNFINELRTRKPEPAFYSDHESYRLLVELLRAPTRVDNRRESPCPPNDSGGTPGLHSTLCDSPILSPDPTQGSPSLRHPQQETKSSTEEQCRIGERSSRSVNEVLNELRVNGIHFP